MNYFMFCASRIRAPCRARGGGGEIVLGVEGFGLDGTACVVEGVAELLAVGEVAPRQAVGGDQSGVWDIKC